MTAKKGRPTPARNEAEARSRSLHPACWPWSDSCRMKAFTGKDRTQHSEETVALLQAQADEKRGRRAELRLGTWTGGRA